MVRFETLITEKIYPYENAVASAEYKNGTFGDVTDGEFSASAGGFKVIMNIENGDDAKSDKYVVKAGENIRVADLAKMDGQMVSITSAQLPSIFAVEDKLVAGADGVLAVSASPTGSYIEVTEKTRFGANGKIVVA